MSKEDHLDDRRHSSTRLLRLLLDDEMLADRLLLNPHSLIRKKRDNEIIFNDLCYLALVEKIKITCAIKNRQEHLTRIAQEETQSYLHYLKQKLESQTLYDKIDKNNFYIDDYQLLQINQLQDRLRELLEKINKLIDSISKTIEIEKEKVMFLENEINLITLKFSDKWYDHFDRKTIERDLESIKSTLSLPDEFKSILDKDDYNNFIFDKNMYSQLIGEIGEDIISGNVSLLQINEVVKEKVKSIIKNKINDIASGCSVETKKELIDKTLHAQSTKTYTNEVTKVICKSIINNASMKSDIESVITKSNELAQRKNKISIYNSEIEQLKRNVSGIQEKIKISFDLLNSNETHSASDLAPVDKYIAAIALDTINHSAEIDIIQNKTEEMLKQNGLMEQTIEDSFAELEAILASVNDENKDLSDLKSEIQDGITTVSTKFDAILESATMENPEYRSPTPSIR